MIKIIWTKLYLVLLSSILLTSCIKDEALNTEADITFATIENAEVMLQGAPEIGNTNVTFRLRQFTGNYLFMPEFKLTPGANIIPASGTELDFFEPKTYRITSEDGTWTKDYEVSFIIDDSTMFTYSFEHVELITTTNPTGLYHEFFEYTPNMQKKKDWSNANQGFNILASTLLEEGEELTPSFYPTFQDKDGFIGKAVRLQTKSTGALGGLFGSPMAAGNLYLGIFDFTYPAIKSTKFGLPYTNTTAPKAIKGFFKYRAGKDFVVNNKPSDLTKDTWDAYAVFFEKTGEKHYLEGDHNFKDPRIVSIARIKASDRIETETWTAFEIQFEYLPGKHFDPEKEYMYTIVFAASKEGDKFNGAVGSMLWIDEVQLITE